MGICGSKDARTRDINARMKLDKKEDKKKIKILLLGAGESGKTTLFKQMKLLYADVKEFTHKEKTTYQRIIYKNILGDILTLVHTAIKRFGQLETPGGIQASKAIQQRSNFNPRHPPPVDGRTADIYRAIWEDPMIQDVWNNRDNVQVQDAIKYYMDKIHIIAASDWHPTNDDILRARARTTGYSSSFFTIDSTSFEMYDVGGQRTERKKWLHYFNEVTTILFIAAISEYNQVLFEDSTVNRQEEAVTLFKDQLSLPNFNNVPFILFLNKKDLFREKITKIPFRIGSGPNKRNVDFKGPHIDIAKTYQYEKEGEDNDFETCYVAAIRYLVMLYEGQATDNRGASGHIYSHPTNSTDSENIRRIMNNCQDIILNGELLDGGWV